MTPAGELRRIVVTLKCISDNCESGVVHGVVWKKHATIHTINAFICLTHGRADRVLETFQVAERCVSHNIL